ncbi:sigma-70 family RNA polymerase sigma factor [Bacillus sp. FJAT-49732]|uniref:Sigma-70 family RNA polymerase sigma factor n=1 Tax=Lederbergia citrisecunda TaxID=2833583 RepID=A0A942TPQ4_9BACI|nr:sigma-70 family RNA polymerase sigma factor [Lederbergia citrisecunda]MBS4201143.1 sigma-70 family RNA polymerase sigma factor [Lederbergia citrisecunda]
MENIDIVKNAIKGDEQAFELLLKQESSKLYRTAFLYVGNKEDALDVVQETVYKAYKSIGSLKNPEYFSTWIIKILIRTAYRILEKNRKLTTIDYESLVNLQDHKVIEIHQNIDLADALNILNENDKTAIILFYYHDLPIHKIATMMDKPEGTVKSYLRRAKIELKKILEGDNHYEQNIV